MVAEFDRAGVNLSKVPADAAAAALRSANSRGKGYLAALLDAGIPLGAGPSSPGSEALLSACSLGSLRSARLLLDHGVDVDATNKRGETALYYAAHGGHLELVDFLIERGARVDVRGPGNRSALYAAAVQGYAGVVETLLHHGADNGAGNAGLRTPLHAAVSAYERRRRDTSAAVAVLIANGADVNAPGGNYCAATPLGLAVKAGSAVLVELLLKHGANAGVEDDCLHKTPIEYVRGKRSKQYLLPLFEAWNKKPLVPGEPSSLADVKGDVKAQEKAGQKAARAKAGRCDCLRQVFVLLATGPDGQDRVFPIAGNNARHAIEPKSLRAHYGSTGMPPYLRLDPGDNAATLEAAMQAPRGRRLSLSDAYLVLVGGDGGFIPYLPFSTVESDAYKEMKQAPADGYQRRLLIEPSSSGPDQYFYCRIDGKYGKGRVVGLRFKFSRGRARALVAGLEISLGADGDRDLDW